MTEFAIRLTDRAALLALALMLAGCSGAGNSAVVDYLIGDGEPSPPRPTQPAASSPPSPGTRATLDSAPVLQDASNTRTAALQTRKFKIPKGTQRVIAVVNDKPVTDFDVTQRMRLNRVLGFSEGSSAQQRKSARQEVIDDVIKRDVAKKHKIEPNNEQINDAIARMAKGAGSSEQKLYASLQKNGISKKQFREYVSTTIAFRWILSRKYKTNVEASEAEIDHQMKKFDSDPRLQPVKIYVLQEITLPVEQASQSMYGQLLQARAVEAHQIKQRYRGCKSARRAARGIYNVKIGRTIKAPAKGLPPRMRQVLDKTGPGRLLGPMRAPEGIRLIGFCGRSSIKPPKPPRDVVRNIVLHEKFKTVSERAMRDLRRSAYIDYKDQG